MNFALKSEGALKSKYNVTFGQCLECAKEQRSMGWCETCESNAFKANFKNWSSDNLVIDDLIRHTQLNASGSVDYLEYIEFEKFDLVEYKNKSGAFSTIYSAIWLEGPRRIWDHHAGLWTRNGPIKVALKRLNNSQNISKEYLNQLYEYHHCLQIGSIVDYFGITKDPTSNYMFVMSYYENDLYSYLDEAQGTICWRDTVEMLWEISGGIEYIHENGLIHGNLHGGNLLVDDKQDSIDIHIDMGLYGPADKKESNDIYGVLPYVAPEILQGNPPTKELDIYSFGIIMWTLSAGIRPWCNRPHDLTLATEVCSGLRPEIIDGTPDAYIQLMKKCWHSDPLKRPTASQICELLESWITAICDEPDQSELSDQFDIAEEKKFSDLIKSKFRKQQIHPQAFYTSRRLYFLN